MNGSNFGRIPALLIWSNMWKKSSRILAKNIKLILYRHLLRGEVEQVIAAVQGLCRGRNSKAIRTQRDYFIKNKSRMAYAKLIAMKLPIGSGAIESTVRRVVNLRLKGPSLFWCRANAEAILLLRSYYKAGRWNMLKRMATSPLALLEA